MDPAVRARATLDLLSFLDEYRPGLRSQVRGRIPETTLAAFDDTAAVEWLSIEHTHHLVDGIVEIVGRDEAPDVWAAYLQQSLIKSALLRTFTDAALRLYQTTPTRLFWLIPRAWETGYRGFCTVRVVTADADAKEATLCLDNIAPQVFVYSNYFLAFQGVFRGMLQLANAIDSAVTLKTDPASASSLVHMRWRSAP